MFNEKIKSILIKSAIIFTALLILLIIYLSIKGFNVLVNYCNGTFLFGIITVLIGGLAFVANAGGFDGFGYSFYYVFKGSRKKTVEDREYKNYSDYVEKKNINRKGKYYTIFPYFIVGALYLIASLILLLMM